MVKNYKDFLNENYDDYDPDEDSMKDLFLQDLERSITKAGFDRGDSYTNLALQFDLSPEADVRAIQKQMDFCGWTVDRVKQAIDDELVDDYNKDSGLIAGPNGYMDVYLNHFDKRIDLCGVNIFKDWSDSPDIFAEEYIIKFHYSWHKTPYGFLLIKEQGSVPKFLSNVKKAYSIKLKEQGLKNFKLVHKGDLLDIIVPTREGIGHEDWEGLERQMAAYNNLPDCIPINAREWMKFKTQYNELMFGGQYKQSGVFKKSPEEFIKDGAKQYSDFKRFGINVDGLYNIFNASRDVRWILADEDKQFKGVKEEDKQLVFTISKVI